MKNLFACMGGVLTALIFVAALSFFSCANSAGSGSEGNPNSDNPQSSQDNQLKINYALGEPPQSKQLTEDQYHIDEEISEGIYVDFNVPEKTWQYRVYIEGLGAVAESVYEYTEEDKKKGCFYYPFVEAGKEYTIRIVFLRDEDRDENNKDISFGHRGDDGSIGWFETKVTAGSESKGEVRFTSKGKIDVKKNGEFKFIEKPTFQNEKLLGSDWEVDIGLVEGISWEHGPERWTKWHSMQIPSDELGKPINLYEDQKNEKTENKYSIDFICVRPILNYEYEGKTYKYQWDSFVRDIYYPPIANSDLINGIYVEYPVLSKKEEYSRCDVYIDGIGKVAEMKDDSINFLDSNKSQASFFYPFVEPGKKYTVRFSFKKPELPINGFVYYTPEDDTITEYKETVTVGAKSKGEVRLTSKGKVDAASTKQGNFKFTEKPTFENEELLGDDWQIELGLMEGISWEHDTERRTKWHCTVQIPSNKLDVETNLYEKGAKESDSIDCICIRPILLNYEYKGKKYSYQWDGFVHDVYYPLRNPDGIYVELDLPKQPFSRCDVTIDGIGKVAEEVKPLEGNPARASFFYPFLEPNKEYTIHFSFKDIEIPDSEGFVCYTTKNDTLSEVKMNVTAGSRAKGQVRLKDERWWIYVDPSYNVYSQLIYDSRTVFENEGRLTGKEYDWMLEIGLMEGISWEHGDERRTKWYHVVHIPKYQLYNNSISIGKIDELYDLHNLEYRCNHDHDIDCLCIRPVMFYEYDRQEYKYMWDGYATDVYYPPKSWFEEIDINDLSQLKRLNGTWKSDPRNIWYDENIHYSDNEILEIDSSFLKITTIYEIEKWDNTAFYDEEKATFLDYQNYPNGHRCNSYLNHDCDSNKIEISNDEKMITKKYACSYHPISQYFENSDGGGYSYNYKLNISKDGKILQIHQYNDYNSMLENYQKQ